MSKSEWGRYQIYPGIIYHDRWLNAHFSFSEGVMTSNGNSTVACNLINSCLYLINSVGPRVLYFILQDVRDMYFYSVGLNSLTLDATI
jgi:hypothetical protein